jgi:hypothetical protein
MPPVTDSELEQLSSQELHDRAMKHARRHMDVGFLWRVLKALPAAQAAGGDIDEANADITHVSALITDALTARDDPEALEGLRPMYIEYLGEN